MELRCRELWKRKIWNPDEDDYWSNRTTAVEPFDFPGVRIELYEVEYGKRTKSFALTVQDEIPAAQEAKTSLDDVKSEVIHYKDQEIVIDTNEIGELRRYPSPAGKAGLNDVSRGVSDELFNEFVEMIRKNDKENSDGQGQHTF